MDMVIMEKQLHASMVMVLQFPVPCQLLLSLLLNVRSAMPKHADPWGYYGLGY